MLLVNDIPNGEPGTAHVGGDGGFCQKQPGREDRAERWRRLSVGGARLARSGISASEAERQGNGPAVSGKGDGVQPGADHPPDRALAADPASGAEAGPAAALSAALQRGGCPAVSRRGRGSRRSFWAGGAAHFEAGVRGVRQSGLRAAGGDLGLAHLQPAPVGGVSQGPRARRAYAGATGFDRRTTPAGPERTTGILARGHRPSRTSRRQAGTVPHQRGRYGDPVADRGMCGDAFGAAPETGAGGHAASVSVSGSRVPL